MNERISPLRVAWRAFGRFREHHMTHHAAALTYYAMMSLFPGMLFGISLLSLLGAQSLATRAADYLAKAGADRETIDAVRSVVQHLVDTSSGAVGIALAVSTVLALNGASGAFSAAGRALNVVYGISDDRSFLRRKLSDLAAALVVIVLFLLVIVAVFLGGGIADDLFGTIGLGDSAAAIWSIVRWPLALVAALVGFGLVYAFAPDRRPPRLRWLSPGAVVGVAFWILASIGFDVYVRHSARFGAVYGAFTGAIVLLLWLWLSANAFLYGAQLNAELERREENRAGNGGTGK